MMIIAEKNFLKKSKIFEKEGLRTAKSFLYYEHQNKRPSEKKDLLIEISALIFLF